MSEREIRLPVDDSLEADSRLRDRERSAGQGRIRWNVVLRRIGKLGLFAISLFLFVLAIILMKEGARELGPVVRDRFNVSHPGNSLGFGWLFAYVVMSGSPVAATSLTFFDAGAITSLDAFAMITGSRLGASFIVLLIGFIYVLRGRDRATSLSMGLLSLIVTGTTYLAGLGLGLFLLTSGWLDGIQLQSGAILTSVTDRLFDPITAVFLTFLPRWGLFAAGFAIILASFNLFDRCVPKMGLKESHFGSVSQLVYKPWVMFVLGAALTTVSMSVSVSLSILVPLSQRGFVRRENVIPYIMGANITTFIDTLLAAVLLNNPKAFTIVLAEMTSITIISIIILAGFYERYQDAMLTWVEGITGNRRRLAVFMGAILLAPLVLLVL